MASAGMTPMLNNRQACEQYWFAEGSRQGKADAAGGKRTGGYY